MGRAPVSWPRYLITGLGIYAVIFLTAVPNGGGWRLAYLIPFMSLVVFALIGVVTRRWPRRAPGERRLPGACPIGR